MYSITLSVYRSWSQSLMYSITPSWRSQSLIYSINPSWRSWSQSLMYSVTPSWRSWSQCSWASSRWRCAPRSSPWASCSTPTPTSGTPGTSWTLSSSYQGRFSLSQFYLLHVHPSNMMPQEVALY